MIESLPASSARRSFQTRQVRDLGYEYWLDLPAGYRPEGPDCPLVLFLHGAGERGADLEQVRKHGPPRLIAEGRAFPFILVSPQCPEG